MPQCPTCGSEVAADADFCPDCGTDLKAAPAAPAPGGAELAPPVPEAGASAPSAGLAPELAPAAAAAPSAPAPEAAPVPETAPPAPAPASAPAAPAPAAAPAAPAAPAPAGGARLTLKRGGALTGDVFPIGGRAVIGRFDTETGPVDVDMGALPEASYVSRHHAEIWSEASGQWMVRDLGSRNGTFVRTAGGSQFKKVEGDQPLSDGDELALGNARFEFRLG